MNASRMMEVLLISGFLGAGKTTLIRHLLTNWNKEIGRAALIINEFGKIGIDGTLLSGRNVDMVELASGCICCTIKTDLVMAVQEIHSRINPDFLIVEATGVAQPGDILDTLAQAPLSEISRPRSMVTVVDVDFFQVREMLGPFYDNQIRCADTILLNKIDLVEKKRKEEVESTIRRMNPDAEVLPTRYSEVEPDTLMRRFSFARNEYPKGEQTHDHDDLWRFQTFSFEDENPLDKEKLTRFLDALPPTLFRCKGWVRFPDAEAYLDFAGGRYRFQPTSSTRNTVLTFVGRNCNEAEILRELRECLFNESGAP
jgi:G3E family GTPase